MKNKIKDGDTIQLTAPSGGVTAGVPHVLRAGNDGQCVMPITSADENALFEADCSGAAFEVPAENDTAWDPGDVIYWDAANSIATKSADDGAETDYDYLGVAHRAKAQASATGVVQLKRLG